MTVARCRLMAPLLALLTLVLAAPAAAAPAKFTLDPEHTLVAFLVDHAGFAKVLGTFRDVQGSFTYDEATRTVSNVRIVVKTDSVYSGHRERDNHLRGPDFLNSREFPEMVFTGGVAEPATDKTGRFVGELTLLGRKQPLTLDLVLNKIGEHPIGGKYTVGVSARGTFPRSPYGMTYGVNNGWVGDQVDLMIEVEARRD